MTGFAGQPPWSLLNTQWLDVPIAKSVSRDSPTWAAFSESCDVCLHGLHSHLARFVSDRTRLENLVTEVFVNHLDVVVSRRGDQEKLDRLVAISDQLLQRAHPQASSRD